MGKIAIIKTGGKQYKVKEGEILSIEKIDQEVGKKVKFDTLLSANSDGEGIEIGKPSLGEKVAAKVIEHGKGKKVNVLKYKNKTRYLRNIGHRQHYTKVQIEKIS